MFLRLVSLSLLGLAASAPAQRSPPPPPSDMQTSPSSDAEMPALSDDQQTDKHRKPVPRPMPQYGSAPAADTVDAETCPPSYKEEADRLQAKVAAQAQYIAALERQAVALKKQIAALRQRH